MADAESPRDPTALPLAGLTILMVEDSRFAAEALRLITMRSGARLRRAETLAQAERHLGLYAPDCLIVDCGLPDGDGCTLIAKAHHGRYRPHVILGLSGDPAQKPRSLAAGADGFLNKPLPPLPHLLRLLRPKLPRDLPVTPPLRGPDPLALQDDLRHALALLAKSTRMPRYIADFVASLAAQSGDGELAAAAAAYRAAPLQDRRLKGLLAARMDESPEAGGAIAMTEGDMRLAGLLTPPSWAPSLPVGQPMP